jgi:hypothetical protein
VLVHDQVPPFSNVSLLGLVPRVAAPLLLSYLLLATLLVGTPLLALVARGTVTGLLSRTAARTRVVAGVSTAAVTAAVSAGLWTQAYPLLIRPVGVWGPFYGGPTRAGIEPVQGYWWAFALVAAIAAAGWAWLAEGSLRTRIIGRRFQPVVPPAIRRSPTISGGAVLMRAGLVLLLLGGLVPGWGHAAIAFAILSGAFLLQNLLLPRTRAARWWTARMPVGVRLVVAGLVGWLLAWQIGRTAYDTFLGITVLSTDSFAPLLYASVVAIAGMAVLMPAGVPQPGGPSEPPEASAGDQRGGGAG